MSYEIHTQRRTTNSLLATSPFIDISEQIAYALCPRFGPITVQEAGEYGSVVTEFTMKPSTELVPTRTR